LPGWLRFPRPAVGRSAARGITTYLPNRTIPWSGRPQFVVAGQNWN
jgi:hypothetical protein